MSAVDTLYWFLANVVGESQPELKAWLEEHKKEILNLKTENERQRAVRRLINEYKKLHQNGHK